MTNKKSEADQYREIVEAVKAEAAKKPPDKVSGDWVTWETQRCWAKANGRPFVKPKPAEPGMAEPPPAPAGGEGRKPRLPELHDDYEKSSAELSNPPNRPVP